MDADVQATSRALPGWKYEKSNERFAVVVTRCREAADGAAGRADRQPRI